MVFAGQDAWRKHPMITGCAKNPIPGIRPAIGIFAVYLVGDFLKKSLFPETHYHSSVKYETDEVGDVPQLKED
ncbi:unnamed protein product [Heterosigma akashiwo]|eukprot:CAMPEP_0194581724 /NCGR_PEP_ID=MMETSP0292-20121207/15104_1 /TAXON_ID=39354 /ORGANISM="Heterosigma akashiwo, Strain CCMP2393" /LENGTH=72 /DNA_ID=CAMNT_0039435589 /DNA_START=26 /DNA_END=244 /DNA_ORIENTATION=-